MKKILQLFIFTALFLSTISANDFARKLEISLKKDEQKKILVKYDSIEKLFKLRWTLYHNKGLVVLRSYDKIVAQNVLYLRGKNQSFLLELSPSERDYYNPPYFLVKFKDFNYEKNEAIFEIFLSDKNERIELEEL